MENLVVVTGTTLGSMGETEYFPIGSVCRIVNIEKEESGEVLYQILPIENTNVFLEGYWYSEDSLMWVNS